MPNWACTNYVASGDRVELEELVRILNTMPNLLPDTPSGFGRYWLGNLFGAFGMTLEQIERSGVSCRGTFDPDFYAVACLCGPGVDESSEFCLSDDGRLRFSTISAWDKSDDIDSLIVERFPSVSLAWSVTDEFGNFHYTHNPDGLTELTAFALNGLLYSEDDLDELAADLRAFIRQSRWGGCGVLPFGRRPDWFQRSFRDFLYVLGRTLSYQKFLQQVAGKLKSS